MSPCFHIADLIVAWQCRSLFCQPTLSANLLLADYLILPNSVGLCVSGFDMRLTLSLRDCFACFCWLICWLTCLGFPHFIPTPCWRTMSVPRLTTNIIARTILAASDDEPCGTALRGLQRIRREPSWDYTWRHWYLVWLFMPRPPWEWPLAVFNSTPFLLAHFVIYEILDSEIFFFLSFGVLKYFTFCVMFAGRNLFVEWNITMHCQTYLLMQSLSHIHLMPTGGMNVL